jgi:hypothetical protein
MICIVMTIIVFINAILVISMSVWLVLSIDGGNIEKGWILNFLTILWLITTTHTNYSTASVLWDLNCQCFVRSQLPVFCEISTASVLWDLNCQCFVRSQLSVFCEISTASVLWDLNCQCFVRSQLSVFCEISTANVLWDLNCQCFVRSPFHTSWKCTKMYW